MEIANNYVPDQRYVDEMVEIRKEWNAKFQLNPEKIQKLQDFSNALGSTARAAHYLSMSETEFKTMACMIA